MDIRIRSLWVMAAQRSLVCTTSELDFRKTCEKYVKEKDRSGITIVYTRVNGKNKEKKLYSIYLSILQYESSLKTFESVKKSKDQIVELQDLAEELENYLQKRDHKSGLLILAIERVHKLSGRQRNFLASFFGHYNHSFCVMLILPNQEWDRLKVYEDHEFSPFIAEMDYTIKSEADLMNYFKESSQGYTFDSNDRPDDFSVI